MTAIRALLLLTVGEVAMEKIMWLVLGLVAFVAALRAARSQRAMLVGRWAVGILMIVFGAVVNASYLVVDPAYYAGFADPSPFAFVRDTWDSLVAPHLSIFISVLIVFEAVVGAMILSGGQKTQVGLVALMAFHVGQLPFGGVMWIWAPVMLVTFWLLLRAERVSYATHFSGRAERVSAT